MSRKIDVEVAKIMGTWPVAGSSLPPMDQYIPPYSTDIASAWEVVEKLRKEGVYVTLYTGPAEKHKVRLQKYVRPDTPEVQEFIERGKETVPMAICLAALQLKGVEYEPNEMS